MIRRSEKHLLLGMELSELESSHLSSGRGSPVARLAAIFSVLVLECSLLPAGKKTNAAAVEPF